MRYSRSNPLQKIWNTLTASRRARNHDMRWLYYRVGHHLGLSQAMVERLLEAGPLPPRFRYRHFTIPKKDGTRREIVEPGVDLKAAQRKILEVFLRKIKPHPAALGFRRKKSIADHAWAHAGAATIITADIQDFFPSTKRHRVEAWWVQQGYSELDVRLFTNLTVYRGSLPQGAPTSPSLSNLVNYDMDAALTRRVQESGGSYTRYGDDLVFSWPDGNTPPADFEPATRALLREFGYALHPRKGWHVWRRRDEPEITGLILTRRGAVEIPDAMKRLMRELARSDNPADKARLAGYEGYQTMARRR